MKASVDKDRCIFCGMCGGACPDIFRADIDRKSVSLDKELSGDLLDMAKHAESICPTWAITIDTTPAAAVNNA